MTSRDERQRRTAQRLRGVVVELGGEVRVRGGSLDRFDLTPEERAEAEAAALNYGHARLARVPAVLKYRLSRSSRMGRPPST